MQEEEEGTTKSPVSDTVMNEAAASEDTEMKEPQEVDPAIQRLRDAETALHQADSVLEPSCMTHVSEVVQANKGNPARAISFLIDNYHGQTAVCGLIGKWILDLKQRQQQQQSINADEIRTTCSTVIDKVVKERFPKDVADRIVDLS